MTLKDKMKTYNFWISLVSAILLVARIIAGKFNVEIDSSLVMDITTGLCGIFVVLGIISAPTKAATKVISQDANGRITITESAGIAFNSQEQLNKPNQEITNEEKQIETAPSENLDAQISQEVVQEVDTEKVAITEEIKTEEIKVDEMVTTEILQPEFTKESEPVNCENNSAEVLKQDEMPTNASYQKEQLVNLTQQELVEIVLKLQK